MIMFRFNYFTSFGLQIILLTLDAISCSDFTGAHVDKSDLTVEILQDLPFRLSRSVIPLNYRVQLMPILDDVAGFERFTAGGRVDIKVRCDTLTSVIKLHVKDLLVAENSVQVLDENGNALNPQVSYEPEYDFIILTTQGNLTPNKEYNIVMNYTAPISQQRLDGMYLDSYVNPSTGETRYVATTLFAANHARRAFPCFDEPDLKASFEIVLGRASDYHSLSNMHLAETQPMSGMQGWFWDTFTPSPPMSTYLVCMIVSDLAYEEASANVPNSTVHRVYAPIYFIERGGGKYSVNLSLTTLSAFETYYDLPYPLRKLDNVALPQFYFNAMENWGLMTFADRVLIYFEGETPEAQKYQLSLTVSHEVSHNFFGNIVTCQWWTYIWLNEGWATFAAHLGLQLTYPDLRPWDQFVPNIYQVAMDYDDSPNTHPLANEPLTTSAIGGIYDDIAYEKGASLIRMMENFLTENVLQTGVQRYLKKWVYRSPQQDDLFESMQEVIDEMSASVLPSGVTLKEIMNTWTDQAGFPLISVSRTSATEINLSQEQFVKNGMTTGNETWWIPVNILVLTGNSPGVRTVWLRNDQKNITYNLPESDLFIVNPQSIGYYRVLYTANLFTDVVSALKTNNELQNDEYASTRSKIIDDAFSLALFSSNLLIEKAMDLISQIEMDTDYFVWKTVRKHLGAIRNQVIGTASEAMLTDFILKKVKLALQRISVEAKKDPASRMLQEELELWICLIDNALCSDFITIDRDIMNKTGVPELLNLYLSRELTKIINMAVPSSSLVKESTSEQLIAQLGNDGRFRKASIQILGSMLLNDSRMTERKATISLLLKLCSYGSSLDDIKEIQRITQRSAELFHTDDKKRITHCISKIEKLSVWAELHEHELQTVLNIERGNTK